MRNIVIILIIANLGYFGWNRFASEEARALSNRESRDLLIRGLLNNGLTLLGQYEEQAALLRQENLQSGLICFTYGSFISLDDAVGLVEKAQNLGLEAELRLTGDPQGSLYRVFLPPADSRLAAIEMLDQLSEQMSQAVIEAEIYMITRGLLENAIALGVFERIEEATAVQAQIGGLGYSVEIEDIPQSTGPVEVLVRPIQSRTAESAPWLELTVDRPHLSRTENLCETIAQGPQFP